MLAPISLREGNDYVYNRGQVMGLIDTGSGDDFVLFNGNNGPGNVMLGDGNDFLDVCNGSLGPGACAALYSVHTCYYYIFGRCSI